MRQQKWFCYEAAANSSILSHLCVCVYCCVSKWVTSSIPQQSGHTQRANEFWAAYYGDSLIHTLKRDVAAIHPFTWLRFSQPASDAAGSFQNHPAASHLNRLPVRKAIMLIWRGKHHKDAMCITAVIFFFLFSPWSHKIPWRIYCRFTSWNSPTAFKNPFKKKKKKLTVKLLHPLM